MKSQFHKTELLLIYLHFKLVLVREIGVSLENCMKSYLESKGIIYEKRWSDLNMHALVKETPMSFVKVYTYLTDINSKESVSGIIKGFLVI